MAKKIARRRSITAILPAVPAGTAPGTIITPPDAPGPVIRVMAFGPDAATEGRLESPDRIREFLEKWPVTWVNVDGLGDPAVIARMGEIFRLHRLSLADVTNIHQRAKVERYDDYVYVVAQMVELRDDVLGQEQISLFLGKNYVLTFQETYGDCFDPLRDRIRKGVGRVRSAGPDYLAYSILDASIDNYFPLLEQYGEQLEDLQDDVLLRPDRETIGRIHSVKRDLLALRRAMWPHREALNSLFRDPTPLVTEETRIYFRNLYDHAVQILEFLETHRELSSDLVDIYLSMSSKRMGEVMKILTVISTIFMPLTFLAGLYGMNFNTERSPFNMPELNWYFGYPAVLGAMAAVTAALLIVFRRKGWL